MDNKLFYRVGIETKEGLWYDKNYINKLNYESIIISRQLQNTSY